MLCAVFARGHNHVVMKTSTVTGTVERLRVLERRVTVAFVNTPLLDRVTSRLRILIRPSESGRTELGLRTKTMKRNVFLSAVLHVAVAHMRDFVLFRRKVHA